MSRLWPGETPPWEHGGELDVAPERAGIGIAAVVVVFAIALAAWFPYGDTAYWKSDDFLALSYASVPERAVDDLNGNQYGLEGLVWFYRPLITLSFTVDHAIGGADPFVSHVSNAIAHAISTVLILLLASRWLGGFAAIACALVWSCAPSHAGSVLWAVGRVDSHTTVWILLSLLGVVRAIERQRHGALLAVVGCVCALASKESAVVIPGLAVVLGCALAEPGSRLRGALRAAWPVALILVAYLAWRFVLFDRIGGGYGETPTFGALAGGFAISTMRFFNPLEYAGGAVCEMPDHVWLLGFTPVVLALAIGLAKRRFLGMSACAAAYLVACTPLFQVLPHSDNLVNLRYLYLPGMALVGLLACGGAVPCLMALGVWALPFLELRQDYATTSRDVAARHERIVEVAGELDQELLLVAGLPPQNRKGTVLAMHLGIDRLARPPFAETEHTVYALRPLSQSPTAHRLPYGDEIGSPLGTTLGFSGPSVLGLLPKPSRPRLAVEVDGDLTLGSRRLHDANLQRGDPNRRTPTLTLGGDHEAYRFTIFTAMGYVTAIVPAGDRTFDAVFDVLWFEHDPNDPQRFAQALTGPTVFDVKPEFPMMIEGGRIADTPAGAVFATEACARRFVWLKFDRQFANLMDGKVPE